MRRLHLWTACIVLILTILACNLPAGSGPDLKGGGKPAGDMQVTITPTTGEFTSAEFFFFPDQAIFNGIESPASLYDFCSPPRNQPNDIGSGFLLISEFHTLSGSCKGDSQDKTLHREGTLTGVYENGQVSFRLETERIFTPHADGKSTAVITFEGNGPIVGNTATGVGNFDYYCSAEGKLVYCIDESTSLTLSGTMPYQIIFKP